MNHLLHCIVSIVFLGINIQAEAESTAPASGASSFYLWQDKIPANPGKLLRQQPLEQALVLDKAETGIRILYASEGWNDQTVTVSGDVLIPAGNAPEGGWPVLAWAHGTVGVADVCAPSHRGRESRDIDYLNQWLAQGYAIVATDYEGLGTPGTHAYLHCNSEANGIIDAVRAAQQLGLKLSDKWMVVGQSQGGQAALCTGAFASGRAPELDFLGTLATAPAVNWKQRFSVGTPDTPSPFVGMTLLLARGFEVYEPLFKPSETYTDAVLAMMPYTDTLCVDELIGMGMKANLTMGQSLKYVPFGNAPGAASGAEKMEVPVEGWSAPVYIAQGTADQMVRDQDVYDLSAELCSKDVSVTLDIYEGARHSGPMTKGFNAFKPWVANRFASKPAENNCEMINTLAQ